MTAQTFVTCLLVGGALLAGWALVRFERLGPRSLLNATVGWTASGALFIGMPSLVDAAIASPLPEPRLVIAFGIALPVFTAFFLTGAWFMRSLLGSLYGAR